MPRRPDRQPRDARGAGGRERRVQRRDWAASSVYEKGCINSTAPIVIVAAYQTTETRAGCCLIEPMN